MDQGLKRPAVAELESGFPSIVPEPFPCEMPEQAFWDPRPRRSAAPTRVRYARTAVVILWLTASVAFTFTLYRVLSIETPTVLQIVFLVLSTLCFAWVAAGSVSALVGFVALLSTPTPDTIVLPPPHLQSRSRVALLFPVYREDAAEVAALVETACRDLVAAGAGDRFDVFILSDTQDAQERVLEKRIYGELRVRHQGSLQIYIRWRTPNEGKKAGNIRDWVERFGAGYAYFVILDADSIMSADALLRLVAGGRNSARWPYPDSAAPGWRPIAFCAPSAIRGRLLRAGRCGRSRCVARARRQLLGTQCDHQDPRVRPMRWPAPPAGAATTGRLYPEPRFRRGCLDATRRLGGAYGAVTRGFL